MFVNTVCPNLLPSGFDRARTDDGLSRCSMSSIASSSIMPAMHIVPPPLGGPLWTNPSPFGHNPSVTPLGSAPHENVLDPLDRGSSTSQLVMDDLKNEVLRLQRRLEEKQRLRDKAVAMGLENIETLPNDLQQIEEESAEEDGGISGRN